MLEVANEKIKKFQIEVNEQMILYLSRSIGNIEQDLHILVRSIPTDQSAHVIAGFLEMKSELEKYDRLNAQPKNQSLLAKFIRRLGLSGHPKSQSSEDLSIYGMCLRPIF